MELIWLVVGFFVGAWVHLQFTIWLHKKLISPKQDTVRDTVQDTLVFDDHQITIRCAVEQHNGQYFLYRLPGWVFLAQADSIDNCRRVLEKRFGNNFNLIFTDNHNENSCGQ